MCTHTELLGKKKETVEIRKSDANMYTNSEKGKHCHNCKN